VEQPLGTTVKLKSSSSGLVSTTFTPTPAESTSEGGSGVIEGSAGVPGGVVASASVGSTTGGSPGGASGLGRLPGTGVSGSVGVVPTGTVVSGSVGVVPTGVVVPSSAYRSEQ
jgi:hypothetical protein